MSRYKFPDKILLAIVTVTVLVTLNIEIAYYQSDHKNNLDLNADWRKCHNQFKLTSYNGSLISVQEAYDQWISYTARGNGNVFGGNHHTRSGKTHKTIILYYNRWIFFFLNM